MRSILQELSPAHRRKVKELNGIKDIGARTQLTALCMRRIPKVRYESNSGWKVE